MAFNPGGGGGVSGASDVALSGVADKHVLTYDGAIAKWKNSDGLALGTTSATAKAGDYKPTTADLPTGSVFAASKISGAWQARPTSRTDVTVLWIGPDPSPVVVTSGTGGMYETDIRIVTP
jgi:hypothetical protein